MKIISSRFGEIEINEDLIIEFPEGILGFQAFKKFIILTKDENQLFWFLHSVENSDLMFIITNPYFILSDYTFDMSEEDCKTLLLDGNNSKELSIFTITKVDNKKNFFINLKAPLCINFNKKIGKQIILYNYNYSHQYKINAAAKDGITDKISKNTQQKSEYSVSIKTDQSKD